MEKIKSHTYTHTHTNKINISLICLSIMDFLSNLAVSIPFYNDTR